jgi:NTE family protein
LYASGQSPAEIERLALTSSRRQNLLQLTDPSLPRQGILRGDKVLAFLDEVLHGVLFSQLKIPLTLVAVDLNSRKEIHLKEGSVAEAVRATVSIPGIFVPFERNGMRLVDGGLLNNIPADVAREMGADVVVAVNVGGFEDSLWKGISMTPTFSNRVNNLLLTLGESLDLVLNVERVLKLQANPPDFLVQPHFRNGITGVTGFNHVSEVIKDGELAAIRSLPELQTKLGQRLFRKKPHAAKRSSRS